MGKSIKEGYFQEIPIRDEFLWGRVILLVINCSLSNIMKIYRYLAANRSLRKNICLHVNFTITIRKR